jgi:hypothetical protein
MVRAARQGVYTQTRSVFTDDYHPCESCGRKFSEEAYERHSQVCASLKNKHNAQAKPAGFRLRMAYKPPIPKKR